MNNYTTEQHQKQVTLLKAFTQLYGPPHTPDLKICNNYLDDVESNLEGDQFFWVVNLKEQRIERSAGVFRNLGLPDNASPNENKLTLYDIYKIVHQDMQEIIQAQRVKAAAYLAEQLRGKIVPLSNDFLYNVIVCFTKTDGKSIVVKQKSTAFQLDPAGNMVSYLSKHTIMKDYQRDPPNVEITIENQRQTELEKEIQFGAGELVSLPFTPMQRKVLTVLADFEEGRPPSSKVLSDKEFAKLLAKNKVGTGNVTTARTHKRNILNRARQKYDRPFSKLRNLALFLRKFKIV